MTSHPLVYLQPGKPGLTGMETSLHRQLKERYAAGNARQEVALGDYRIDVVTDHELIEIQHGSLGAIRDKIKHLVQAEAILHELERQFANFTRQKGNSQQLRRVQLRMGNFSVQTYFYLGIANLRLGEDQNCSVGNLAEACILPIQ